MTYFLYFCVCLLLVIFQTTILPYFPVLNGCYDLMILFIFYLGLFRSARESILIVFVLGFVMDNLSGASFGLYVTTYFWVFIGVRWIIKFLRVRNIILLPILLTSGILLQNFIFVGTIAISEKALPPLGDTFTKVILQILWVIITGPVFLIVFQYIHYQWDEWMVALLAEWRGQSE